MGKVAVLTMLVFAAGALVLGCTEQGALDVPVIPEEITAETEIEIASEEEVEEIIPEEGIEDELVEEGVELLIEEEITTK